MGVVNTSAWFEPGFGGINLPSTMFVAKSHTGGLGIGRGLAMASEVLKVSLAATTPLQVSMEQTEGVHEKEIPLNLWLSELQWLVPCEAARDIGDGR